VVAALQRIIVADFPIIVSANEHLLRVQGKLFRPTLLFLSQRAAGVPEPRAVALDPGREPFLQQGQMLGLFQSNNSIRLIEIVGLVVRRESEFALRKESQAEGAAASRFGTSSGGRTGGQLRGT